MCDKLKYATRRSAKAAIRWLRYKDSWVYYCHECKAWHITSQKATKAARVRGRSRFSWR